MLKKLMGVLVFLLIIGIILHLGGMDFGTWSKKVQLKDPIKVFQPVTEKLPKVELPKPNVEQSNEVKTIQVGNLTLPRQEVKRLSDKEIVDKEYVTKHELTDKSFYEKLFKEAKADKQVFLYKRDDKPTVTYVKLNKTSIERNYGNQQSFAKKENPVGWNKNLEVDIPHDRLGTYHGHFWNRSHLIADQLGGESIKQNAITGTRTQNVGARNNKGGMRMPEERAYNYVKETGKELLYFVDVVYYENDNLIPNEVRVTLYNDEIQEQYITYNIANGYVIDYKKGTFRKQ